MIRRKHYLGFTVVTVYYEPPTTVQEIVRTKDFSAIGIFTYDSIDLPDEYVRTRSVLTIRVPTLDVEDGVFLERFRKSYRNEIKRSDSDRVKFSIVREEDTREAYDVYRQFETLQKRSAYPFSFFKDLIVFVANSGGIPVSIVACIDARPVLKVFAIASVRHGSQIQVEQAIIGRASKRLIFNACQYARENKYEYLDLAYIDTVKSERAGITAYKQGFGGETVMEYHYEYASRILKLFRVVRGIARQYIHV